MKISVILGHPYENSFNSAIAEAVIKSLKENRHTVRFHDLYRENFNPVIPKEELVSDQTKDDLVKLHQQEIQDADGIVIIHPNWWGQPPAILKGWVDRVLRENIAYAFPEGDNGGGLPIGLLKAKTGLVINTSNTPALREIEQFGDPLNRLWKDCIFDFCGVSDFHRIMFGVVADSSISDREKWLRQTGSFIKQYFPK
ncbi:NAD(P)H-dependent oxidoreductase [Blautia coccoides]|uniref:NAD(P)H-dependent oxidoreductase n=1 Tax=Blautia producta TaxID=33035 RepID=UPI002149C975|nr:NAD(P)H-dependent oxidoreductase [Blautia coccoides]MCR1985009.1 NAD(P)H-dependent oxidoreductase [Blautia coccoides]